MSTNKQALREAAEKFRKTFAAHCQNPKNYDALDAWDKATSEFVAVVNNDELNIIASLLDEMETEEKRIAELTAPDGNAIGWESTTPVYIKFITDERYQRLRPGYQKWYKPYRCSNCAAGITVKGE